LLALFGEFVGNRHAGEKEEDRAKQLFEWGEGDAV